MATRLKQVEVDLSGEETQGARRATGDSSPETGAASAPAVVDAPDPEVVATPTRRHYTAKYKRQVLEEADRCPPGELGALLRRHGLYSSHLTTWRRPREAGALAALSPVKRGPKGRVADPQGQRVVELQRENEHLRQRLAHAETIIEVQKKVSMLLGIDPSPLASGARP